MTADQIKSLLKLEPHPVEGGWFRRTYTSAGSVELPRGMRAQGTAIYYLLETGTFSEMHVLASDEIFHFYRRFYSWRRFKGRTECATRGSDGGMAGDAARGGRKSGAAGVHGDAGVRFCRLPRRELRGVGGEVAGGGGEDQEVDEEVAGLAS